jgi:hypothetical protein
MTHRFAILLMLFGALASGGCGSDDSPAAETDAAEDGAAEGDDGGGLLMLGSAADLIIVSDDMDGQLASLGAGLGGSPAGATASDGSAARGGGQPPAGGGGSNASGSSGPSMPSLSDPGLGRAGGQTISADQIQSTIQRNVGQVRACYERELKAQPSLNGKVVLSWTIGADGHTRSVSGVRNTTGNRELLSCVRKAVRGWRFPQAQSPQDIEYPFVFKPDFQ